MAKGDLPMDKLKNAEIGFDSSVDVANTKMLDGGASDSPVFTESNKTQQYATAGLPKGEDGGRDNKNG